MNNAPTRAIPYECPACARPSSTAWLVGVGVTAVKRCPSCLRRLLIVITDGGVLKVTKDD